MIIEYSPAQNFTLYCFGSLMIMCIIWLLVLLIGSVYGFFRNKESSDDDKKEGAK